MIELNEESGFIIYTSIWFLLIFILWMREIWRRKAFDWSLSKEKLCTCDKCHYAFLAKKNECILRCPRCNSVCIARKK